MTSLLGSFSFSDGNKLCNCNFFTMVGLTHDEGCLIYNLRCGPPSSPDLNPVDGALFGALFSNKSVITENLLLSISWNRPLWENGTSCRSASLTAALTNVVVVLLIVVQQ